MGHAQAPPPVAGRPGAADRLPSGDEGRQQARRPVAGPAAPRPPPHGRWGALEAPGAELWEVALAAQTASEELARPGPSGRARPPAALLGAAEELARPAVLDNLLRGLMSGEQAAYPCAHLLHLCALHRPACRRLLERQCVPILVGLLRACREEEMLWAGLSLAAAVLRSGEPVRPNEMRQLAGMAGRLRREGLGAAADAEAARLLASLQGRQRYAC